jgi:hypothetical protein
MFVYFACKVKVFPGQYPKSIRGLQVYNHWTPNQANTVQHSPTASTWVRRKGRKDQPSEWPREGAYNLSRLVAAGVCTGQKLTPCPREEEE